MADGSGLGTRLRPQGAKRLRSSAVFEAISHTKRLAVRKRKLRINYVMLDNVNGADIAASQRNRDRSIYVRNLANESCVANDGSLNVP